MASRPPATPFDIFAGAPSPAIAPPQLPGGLAGELFASMDQVSRPLEELAAGSALLAPTQAPPERAIDKLRPGSELHGIVRQKLDAMAKFSEDRMRLNHTRWNFMEKKVQAYVNDADYEALLETLKQTNQPPPEPFQIVVPYTYATLHAAATYISSVLLNKKPIFGLNASRGTAVDNARYMEQALQYQLEESGGHETLWQQIWDGLNYSFATARINWEVSEGQIMKMQGRQRAFEQGIIYAGNKLVPVDPYNCLPDPRVPLHLAPERGDFMFTKMELSAMVLKDMEISGELKWVSEALAKTNYGYGADDNASQRRSRIGLGKGERLIDPKDVISFRCVHEGTVRLVPKEWKLGDSTSSELWKFTWIKGGQIMQAEPLNMLHMQHPYATQEPNSLGYDFMSLSMGEMISVFQDILSWLVSSRMENVRAAIANTFVADPARVEINDIRSSTIGRVIRLKQAAMGLPVQQAIQQLITNDVTGGHLADIQTMRMLADSTTGVNDNLRGIQTQGGRRSATEARMSMQAGASRLSQLAVRISAQQLRRMAQQMIINTQQLMPDEMWVEVTGDDGRWTSNKVTPEMMVGSYNFQVTDGSLPVDKMALTEVWKEILFGIAQDPELRQRFSLAEIFKYTAELGGAKNIDSFELPPQPQIAPPGVDPEGNPIGPALPSIPASNIFQ